MASLPITLSAHPEERLKARLEGWSSNLGSLLKHPSRRRFAPQDEGSHENVGRPGAHP